MSTWKQIVRDSPLGTLVRASRSRKSIQQWQDQGKPIPPPPHYKQSVVTKYSKEFRLKVLVETGTYQGEMVAAQRQHFSHIYSIELDHDLYHRAKEKFAGCPHIILWHGDSAQILPEIVKQVNEPCLFWLDAHYSGDITARGEVDTPILQELEIIFSRNNVHDVILIDDARCFDGTNDYPARGQLQDYAAKAKPDMEFEVADDIMRLYTATSARKK